jgi:hypothetical protein
MRLRLNEQEIIDGICVFISNKVRSNPEAVDVKEISVLTNGDFVAKAVCNSQNFSLDSEDVLEGIFQFLEEYHSFNRPVMHGHIEFTKGEGFWAEVIVNE